eukprot:TRINITY_DN10958_c0_g1_i2.p1 TRINITY_DN10958_c0_g1~~TRINITY_DN10958_c0_g1_i2.p1  ORF type:complete len:467 (+),score=87.17 TRINITY_DN10958_c0_g1_i2:103-1401(+)
MQWLSGQAALGLPHRLWGAVTHTRAGDAVQGDCWICHDDGWYSAINAVAADCIEFRRAPSVRGPRGPSVHSRYPHPTFAWSSHSDGDIPVAASPKVAADPSKELLSPCMCTGSVQYAHRSCLIGWVQALAARGERQECRNCNTPYRVISRRVSPLRTVRVSNQTIFVAFRWVTSVYSLAAAAAWVIGTIPPIHKVSDNCTADFADCLRLALGMFLLNRFVDLLHRIGGPCPWQPAPDFDNLSSRRQVTLLYYRMILPFLTFVIWYSVLVSAVWSSINSLLSICSQLPLPLGPMPSWDLGINGDPYNWMFAVVPAYCGQVAESRLPVSLLWAAGWLWWLARRLFECAVLGTGALAACSSRKERRAYHLQAYIQVCLMFDIASRIRRALAPVNTAYDLLYELRMHPHEMDFEVCDVRAPRGMRPPIAPRLIAPP